MATRIEKDTFGPIEVPADRLWGAQTQRSLTNFKIGSEKMPPQLVKALAQVKRAAAQVNLDLKGLDAKKAKAIIEAADEVIAGKHDAEFPLAIWQTGSGTQTNMNMNEVLANRASEILGGPRGEGRLVHPNDHVNRCQSSNDVIPTAMQLAALVEISVELVPALEYLESSLRRKAAEFMPVIKTGRTHLQDATPIRLGQEFLGYAGQVARGLKRLQAVRLELGELPLGEVQPGSSIMPGKVNPVIIESALMVVAEVLGNDATIAVAAQAGSIFELNLMMPVAAYNLLQSIGLLARAAENLAKRCIDGLRATDHGPAMVEQGLMLATALAPAIGYDAAAKIAKEALTSGKTVSEIARQRAGLKPEELDRLLDPARMTEPGLDAGGSQR